MNPSYAARLLLLSSASWFLVQMMVGAVVALISPVAIRHAGRMRPLRAGRLLLALRLLPSWFSAASVALLCVPSYLRFEPRVAAEEAGITCIAAAFLGMALGAIAIYRTARALIRSSQYVRNCGGQKSRIDGQTVWIVPQSAGLALAGILHPKLLISKRALDELSDDQLAVALRHEQSHRAYRDNLKRLLILLAPPILPGMKTLEQGWAKCAEWAADDRATGGDAERSVTLAGAVLCVARLQSRGAMPPLVTSLVEADEDLSLRVDRLLRPTPVAESGLYRGAISSTSAALFSVVVIALNPGYLRIVHDLLERLFD